MVERCGELFSATAVPVRLSNASRAAELFGSAAAREGLAGRRQRLVSAVRPLLATRPLTSLPRLAYSTHLPPPRCLLFLFRLRCVTRALMHMHEQGMIHGDIKPLNVMRMSDGKNVWKLVSLGVAHTHEFAPPERRTHRLPPHTAGRFRLGDDDWSPRGQQAQHSILPS